MISRPLVKYILTAAMRDRLVITLGCMIALGMCVGFFLGSASMTEQHSFSAVFGAGGLRFLGVAGIVLFVCFYMRRAFETKEVEFLLSRPLSRGTYLASHAFAFVLLSFLTALLVAFCVGVAGTAQPAGLMVWGLSIAVEYAIMAVTALFFAMVLSSAAGSALATLGFYVLARLIGTLIGIARLPADNIVFAVLNNVMELVSVIVPRLDLMGQTSWLVYGVAGDGGLALSRDAGAYAHAIVSATGVAAFLGLQGIVFIALTLLAAAFDFSRREF